jgi:hypothetical protein
MAAAYGGLDVRDPRMSLRRFKVLLDRLPPHARSIGEQWSVEAELLAIVADRVAELTWLLAKVNGGKSTRPKPLPRPKRDKRPDRMPADIPASGPREPTSGWMAAAEQLAMMPGVKVRHG